MPRIKQTRRQNPSGRQANIVEATVQPNPVAGPSGSNQDLFGRPADMIANAELPSSEPVAGPSGFNPNRVRKHRFYIFFSFYLNSLSP